MVAQWSEIGLSRGLALGLCRGLISVSQPGAATLKRSYLTGKVKLTLLNSCTSSCHSSNCTQTDTRTSQLVTRPLSLVVDSDC